METRSIEERIEQLENLMYQCKNVLTFDEAARFLGFSKSYLYKLTAGNRIPYYKPQGKMVYFEKAALEDWLRQNPVKTDSQISQDAEKYMMSH